MARLVTQKHRKFRKLCAEILPFRCRTIRHRLPAQNTVDAGHQHLPYMLPLLTEMYYLFLMRSSSRFCVIEAAKGSTAPNCTQLGHIYEQWANKSGPDDAFNSIICEFSQDLPLEDCLNGTISAAIRCRIGAETDCRKGRRDLLTLWHDFGTISCLFRTLLWRRFGAIPCTIRRRKLATFLAGKELMCTKHPGSP